MTEDEFVLKNRAKLRGGLTYGLDVSRGRLSEMDKGQYADFVGAEAESMLREYYRQLCPSHEQQSAKLRLEFLKRIEAADLAELGKLGGELADMRATLTPLDLAALREAFDKRRAKHQANGKEPVRN